MDKDKLHPIIVDFFNTFPKRLGKRLQFIRKSRGMTNQEMANFLGVSISSMQKYEYGLRMPPLSELIYICFTFNVGLEWLILGDDYMTKIISETAASSPAKQEVVDKILQLNEKEVAFATIQQVLKMYDAMREDYSDRYDNKL